MDMDTDSPVARHIRLKLHVGDGRAADAVVFLKGTWFPSRFPLSITDGLDAWVCDATEAEVRQRAEHWDQPVSEYTAMAERYLGFQQPGSVYRFEDAGNGQKRMTFARRSLWRVGGGFFLRQCKEIPWIKLSVQDLVGSCLQIGVSMAILLLKMVNL